MSKSERRTASTSDDILYAYAVLLKGNRGIGRVSCSLGAIAGILYGSWSKHEQPIKGRWRKTDNATWGSTRILVAELGAKIHFGTWHTVCYSVTFDSSRFRTYNEA